MKKAAWLLEAIETARREGRILGETNVVAPSSQPPADRLSEKDFQAEVVAFAKRQGWLVYHTYDSRRSQAGFPDLVLVKTRIVWVELKSGTGNVTADQATWMDALQAAGAEVYVWRPSDWAKIVEVLA